MLEHALDRIVSKDTRSDHKLGKVLKSPDGKESYDGSDPFCETLKQLIADIAKKLSLNKA